MKCKSIRLMISLVTLLTLCLTFSAGSVWAEGEEYLGVTVEIKDIGGKLPKDTSFLITFARKDEADKVSPLPDKTQIILKPGETDEFRFERTDFTEPGDYLYTIKQEKATGDDNVITEDITYNVTVRVVNGDSGLNATVNVRKAGQNAKLESALFRNNDKRARYKQPNQGDSNDIQLFPPKTGEAFPYWPLGLMGAAALLGAWGIGRQVKTSSARKDGNEQ